MVGSLCCPVPHKSPVPSNTVAAKIRLHLTTTKTEWGSDYRLQSWGRSETSQTLVTEGWIRRVVDTWGWWESFSRRSQFLDVWQHLLHSLWSTEFLLLCLQTSFVQKFLAACCCSHLCLENSSDLDFIVNVRCFLLLLGLVFSCIFEFAKFQVSEADEKQKPSTKLTAALTMTFLYYFLQLMQHIKVTIFSYSIWVNYTISSWVVIIFYFQFNKPVQHFFLIFIIITESGPSYFFSNVQIVCYITPLLGDPEAVSRPDEILNPCSVFWVCSVPGKPPVHNIQPCIQSCLSPPHHNCTRSSSFMLFYHYCSWQTLFFLL